MFKTLRAWINQEKPVKQMVCTWRVVDNQLLYRQKDYHFVVNFVLTEFTKRGGCQVKCEYQVSTLEDHWSYHEQFDKIKARANNFKNSVERLKQLDTSLIAQLGVLNFDSKNGSTFFVSQELNIPDQTSKALTPEQSKALISEGVRQRMRKTQEFLDKPIEPKY